MVAITLDGTVDEDRKLTIHVPNNIPAGRVEVTIRSLEEQPETKQPLTRETARAKLLAAGRLSTIWSEPEDFVPLTDAELWELGQRIPDARPAEDYINEDRGAY